jgi:hypothetical protein
MSFTLPTQFLFHPTGNEHTNWHDYYGAIKVLSEYAQHDYQSMYPVAYWNHGASFPIDTKFANMLTLGIVRDRELPIWLHREEDSLFFRSARHVHSIGQAYVYAHEVRERQRGSVLIMPGHSIGPDRNLHPQLFSKYVEDVKQIYPPRENTYVCLNSNCLRNGYWVTEFTRAGYTLLSGSRTDDLNSYNRMKMLFGYFETVVSNVLGSHVVYAAADGCSVGIWGEQVFPDNSLDMAACIDFNYRMWRDMSESEYPFLFTEPGSESINQDWGRSILGYQHKRKPLQIKGYLEEAYSYHKRTRRRSVLNRVLNKLARITRGH